MQPVLLRYDITSESLHLLLQQGNHMVLFHFPWIAYDGSSKRNGCSSNFWIMAPHNEAFSRYIWFGENVRNEKERLVGQQGSLFSRLRLTASCCTTYPKHPISLNRFKPMESMSLTPQTTFTSYLGFSRTSTVIQYQCSHIPHYNKSGAFACLTCSQLSKKSFWN